jgi:dipeptide transport system ATP-binding protein
MGLAYLFISHRSGVVRHIAHDVLVMYLATRLSRVKTAILLNPRPHAGPLLASTPGLAAVVRRASARPEGRVSPSPLNPPVGCAADPLRDRALPQRAARAAQCCRAVVVCHYAEQFPRPEPRHTYIADCSSPPLRFKTMHLLGWCVTCPLHCSIALESVR